MKFYLFNLLSTGIITILVLTFNATADDEIQFGDRIPQEDEIVQALSPPESNEPEGYKSRSIRPSKAVVKPQAISMEITFKKNSYRLSNKAQTVLDVVGKSLNSNKLKEYRFVIEGHTDASGGEELNRQLSDQRAAEVKRYLVQNHFVSPNRLTTIGKGETDLLIKNDPYAPRNRRVRIINMGN